MSNVSKTDELYKTFDVEIIKNDVISDNDTKVDDENVTLFELKFTDKKTNKRDSCIYNKQFSVRDINDIKTGAFNHVDTSKFVKLILDCLSKNNREHNVSFKIDNTGKDKYLVIIIKYIAGLLAVDIILKLPAKIASKIDILTARLNKTEALLADILTKYSKLEDRILTLESTKINEPVLIKEMYNEQTKIHRKKGWNIIRLNDIEGKDNDISLDKKRHKIRLNKGKYIFNSFCGASKGKYTRAQLKSTDNTINVFGSKAGSPESKYGDTVSIILNAKIVIPKAMEFEMRLYVDSDIADTPVGGNCKDKNGEQYMTSISIQKIG